jgi:hypothetical protein
MTFIIVLTLRTALYMALKLQDVGSFFTPERPQHILYICNICSECVIAVMLFYFIWKSAMTTRDKADCNVTRDSTDLERPGTSRRRKQS